MLNIIYTDGRSEDMNEDYRSGMTSHNGMTSHHDQDGFTLITRKDRKKGQLSKAASKARSHKKQVSKRTKTGKKTENKG